MFASDFEKTWAGLRSKNIMRDSVRMNVTLANGQTLQHALLCNKREHRNDLGTVLKREAIFQVGDEMCVVPVEDIVSMSIL